jgi:hypothetical protein
MVVQRDGALGRDRAHALDAALGELGLLSAARRDSGVGGDLAALAEAWVVRRLVSTLLGEVARERSVLGGVARQLRGHPPHRQHQLQLDQLRAHPRALPRRAQARLGTDPRAEPAGADARRERFLASYSTRPGYDRDA